MNVAAVQLDVSRETLSKLEQFAAQLIKWNARINLVAPSTISDIWTRHILDSTQIFDLAPRAVRHWVDLGSGGGLPAIVCAILAQEKMPECRFTLIESDRRKAAFLMTAARDLGLAVEVLAERAEVAPMQAAGIVSARALAPLLQLLPLITAHLAPDGVALLPKGKNHAAELAAARVGWHFDLAAVESQTDPLARVLILKGIARV